MDLFLSILSGTNPMVFCGGCGKRASDNDRFCTSCGTPVVETKISVAEEVGQIIKEEYKSSQAPPNAELSQGDYIGDKKQGGEWLEFTVEHILKFAGFQTQRHAPFVFNDGTGDKFVIDILATDPDTEIFVECKDLSDLKMSEKIMYTLKGQLDDYRKRQTRKVVGILAMTARDDGRNSGIRERLRRDNAFLWDGSFIENLKNKMTEIGNKDDFRRYVLDHLDIFEQPTRKNDGYNFIVKYSFYTVPPDLYVGKTFDVMHIIDDIRDSLDGRPIKIVNHKFDYLKSETSKKIVTCRIMVDLSMSLTGNEVVNYAEEKKGLFDKILRRDPIEIVRRKYEEEIYSILAAVYGIRYDPKGKSEFDKITFLGARIA